MYLLPFLTSLNFFFKSPEFLRTFIITTISKQAFYHDCFSFITINLVFRGVQARENTKIFKIFYYNYYS